MRIIKEYSTTVYISHPSGGLPENTEKVEKIIDYLSIKFPEVLFVSPIHSFGHRYDKVSYVEGLNMCFWLLDKCNEVWIFGDWKNSTGCNCELAYSKNNGIPWKIIPDNKCYNAHPDFECVASCAMCTTDDGGIYCTLDDINKDIRGGK